jgi:hypothetical protein
MVSLGSRKRPAHSAPAVVVAGDKETAPFLERVLFNQIMLSTVSLGIVFVPIPTACEHVKQSGPLLNTDKRGLKTEF